MITLVYEDLSEQVPEGGRADVEKLVDTAIANSHKLGRKLSGLFSSNKNDDGLYILIESDFIF